MLHFLSSLFSDTSRLPGGPETALVEAAIERLVDATDPRLRGFGNYRKRLYAGVQQSVIHIQAMIDGLPEPVEVSRRTFGSDPRLRAFFASPDRLQHAIANAPSVVDYLARHKGPYSEFIYGLLAPKSRERQVIGMDLQGDQVRRDVLQKVMDFSDHRFFGAAGSESEARDEMKKRAFDFLAGLALKRILDIKEKRAELAQQRRLLQRKFDAMQVGNWGLEPMLGQEETPRPDYAALEKQIEAGEAELLGLCGPSADLETHFDCINAVFEKPEEGLALRPVEMQIDAMSLKISDPSDASSQALQLDEMYSSSGARRMVLFGYFPRNELPPESDFFKEAQRFLG